MQLTDQFNVGDKVPEKWIKMIKDVYESGNIQTLELERNEKLHLFRQIPIVERGYVNVYATDITEQKKSKEQLLKSEELNRRIIESSRDCIKVLDMDGHLLSMSAGGQKLLEIDDITPYLNRSWVDFWKGKDREAALAAISIAKKDDVGTFYGYFETAKGKPKWWEIVISPIKDSQGNIEKLLAVSRDITERKKSEKILLQSQKLESIGILAGGISHDFNNLMMGIYLNISLAKHHIPKDHPGFKFLEKSEESLGRAKNLTGQLLTFAKGGAPVKENISFGEFVEEISCFDLSGSSVKPVFECAEDLWRAKVDKGQIQQVLSNLIINARQAMPYGGKLYIKLENADIPEGAVGGLKQGIYVKVTMRDEGTGISQKHLEKVFEPFFSTKEMGRGIGLATVYSIIKRHGGIINVESELGRGTTFTFYLPAVEEQPLLDTKQTEAVELSEKQHTGRILVMDDEEIICESLTELLSDRGFSVSTAPDSKQALKMYKQSLDDGEPFDAVILDLTIRGGMGGEKAVKELLKIDPKSKCIVSSGYANDTIMSNYSDYGFKGVAVKPYTPDKLLEVLSQVLNK